MAQTKVRFDRAVEGATNIVDTGTEGTRVATGTTAQRGSTTGQLRFNTDTGLAEYYDGSAFKSIDSPPTISSISPTSLGQSVLGSSQTIVITGSSFSSTVTVKIIGNDGTEITPASTTRNSSTQITITTPTSGVTNTNEPYDIKVTNTSNLSATLVDALSINDTPVFSTASGSLGTLQDADRSASNLTAISFSDEESTPTVSVTSGSIPTGLTLNSNGTWSGTANVESSDQTYNFTVTATDGSETATRDYSITVIAPLSIDVEYLVIAGGGAGGGGHRSGGGGAGGYRNSYASETSGRNSSTETPYNFTNTGTVITVTVGGGGAVSSAANGGTGGSSSISASGKTTITSYGGGGGGEYQASADAGTYGSGGGGGQSSSNTTSGSNGTAGQGFDGGDTNSGSNLQQGGSGGGAGANGQTGGTTSATTGGVGLSSSITGSAVFRAGGGGGGSYGFGGYSSGGNGGGGNGASTDANDPHSGVDSADSGYYYPVSGTDNTGGGGGGTAGGSNPSTYGRGGSGVVILRVPTANYSGTTTGSPTVSTVGSDKVLIFNSSGSYTV